MYKFLSKIVESRLSLLLLAGLLFFVGGIFGLNPNFKQGHLNVVNDLGTTWRVVALIVGVMLMLIGVNDILDPTTVSSGAIKDVEEYKIVKLSPDDGDDVTIPFIVHGECAKPLPAGQELWLYSISSDGSVMWPQRKATFPTKLKWRIGFDRDENKWMFDHLSNRCGYCLVVVGKDGQTFLEFYFRVNNMYREKAGQWASGITLVSDMVRAGETHWMRLTGDKAHVVTKS